MDDIKAMMWLYFHANYIVEVKGYKKNARKEESHQEKASISRRKKKKKEENELEKDTFLHIHSVCILKMYIYC